MACQSTVKVSLLCHCVVSPIYSRSDPSSVIVEGTADVDARFFLGHAQWAPAPFSITVALLSSSSMVPLDWNQEDPSQCGLRQSTPNPNSHITILPRITVDEELCCVSFTIAIPSSLLSSSQSQQAPPLAGGERADYHNGSLWREFGVAVKAYDATGRVTQTNIANFAVRFPKAVAAVAATQTKGAGIARRMSQALMGRRRRSSAGTNKSASDAAAARGRQMRKQSVVAAPGRVKAAQH